MLLNVYAEVGDRYYDFIEDFKSYPKRYDLGEAKPKAIKQKIEVPYADGVLFPTSWLGEIPRFEAREMKINVKIASKTPELTYSHICSALNGKYGKIITNTMPDYFNEGLICIGALKTTKTAWEFQLTMTAQPYKMRRTETIITHVYDAAGTWADFISNEHKPVYPTLVLGANGRVTGTINGRSVDVSGKGAHEVFIPLKAGKNDVVLTSSVAQTILIRYREGRL